MCWLKSPWRLREADALLETARRHKRILQVGHVERFNPAVVAVAPILNRPLFSSYTAAWEFSLRAVSMWKSFMT
jgi:hypothetical protein